MTQHPPAPQGHLQAHDLGPPASGDRVQGRRPQIPKRRGHGSVAETESELTNIFKGSQLDNY